MKPSKIYELPYYAKKVHGYTDDMQLVLGMEVSKHDIIAEFIYGEINDLLDDILESICCQCDEDCDRVFDTIIGECRKPIKKAIFNFIKKYESI